MRGGVLVEIEVFLVSGMSDTPNFFWHMETGLQHKYSDALYANTCLYLVQGKIQTLWSLH